MGINWAVLGGTAATGIGESNKKYADSAGSLLADTSKLRLGMEELGIHKERLALDASQIRSMNEMRGVQTDVERFKLADLQRRDETMRRDIKPESIFGAPDTSNISPGVTMAGEPSFVQPTVPLPDQGQAVNTNYLKANAYLPVVAKLAQDKGLPPGLAESVMKVESSYNPNAFNSAGGGQGAAGLFQLRGPAAAQMGVTDRMDPAQNMRGGVDYLAMCYQKAGGDQVKALLMYHDGPNHIGPPSKEGLAYASKVMGAKAGFEMDAMADPAVQRQKEEALKTVVPLKTLDPAFAAYPKTKNVMYEMAQKNGFIKKLADGSEAMTGYDFQAFTDMLASNRKAKLEVVRSMAADASANVANVQEEYTNVALKLKEIENNITKDPKQIEKLKGRAEELKNLLIHHNAQWQGSLQQMVALDDKLTDDYIRSQAAAARVPTHAEKLEIAQAPGVQREALMKAKMAEEAKSRVWAVSYKDSAGKDVTYSVVGDAARDKEVKRIKDTYKQDARIWRPGTDKPEGWEAAFYGNIFNPPAPTANLEPADVGAVEKRVP